MVLAAHRPIVPSRTSFTCPPGSYAVCPPKERCYCEDFSYKLLRGAGPSPSTLIGVAIGAAAILAACVIGKRWM